MALPLLSVIIPTLNEEACLPTILADLLAQQGIGLELIVADGGSSDATRELAVKDGAVVVAAEPGRGRQMNVGAAVAKGDLLLFLHADSRLTDVFLLRNACLALEQAEVSAGNRRVAGHFPLRFRRTSPAHTLAFGFLEAKSHLNRPNTINGDQGFLLRRDFFTELGGFEETLPFLEDQKLAARIRRQGSWVTLPGHLATSARRFDTEGFHRCYLRMGIIMGLHSAGATVFFKRAKTAYPAQQDTCHRSLWPMFSLIWTMMRHDLGLVGSLRAWFLAGRFVRQNCWQMFFFIDVVLRTWLRTRRDHCLRLYDCCVGPLLGFSLFDVLFGGLAFVWFMGVLAPWFWLLEWFERRGAEHG